jgi:hypothetical protein
MSTFIVWTIHMEVYLMKRFLIAVTALAIGSFAFAQGMPMMEGRGFMGPGFMHRGSYLSAEAQAIAAELGGKAIGEFSLNELGPYEMRLRLAAQKDAYVERSAMASMRLPGSGQFKNGDTAGGSLFLAAHIATVAGSLVGEYFLLPANLRFDKLDYLNSSLSDIKTAWGGHSLVDYLPSMGIALAGMIVDGGLKVWSASSAYAEAKASVDSDKAKLRPLMGPGFIGMGMRY